MPERPTRAGAPTRSVAGPSPVSKQLLTGRLRPLPDRSPNVNGAIAISSFEIFRGGRSWWGRPQPAGGSGPKHSVPEGFLAAGGVDRRVGVRRNATGAARLGE